MAETQPAMTYPTEAQYDRWKQEANDRDMSVSEFMSSMVEAGLKTVEAVEVEPDETRRELRQDRNRLKQEVEQLRQQVEYLETQQRIEEREAVVSYVEDNPGCEFDDIVNHVINTAPSRVSEYLTTGDDIRVEGDQFYPENQ